MNVPTIRMEKPEAISKFNEYRKAIHARYQAEDDAMLQCFRELKLGHQLLNLVDAFRATGLGDDGLPKLAIARASWKEVWFKGRSSGSGEFLANLQEAQWDSRFTRGRISMPEQTFEEGAMIRRQARAIVPSIPPSLRPKGNLERYFILFEADWQRAPVDPFLLRHVHGMMFAVLAAWDLTEVERLVLESFRGNGGH